MKNLGSDLFDPPLISTMESDSSNDVVSRDADFGFAFNDSNFSDRTLRIEILADDNSTECFAGDDVSQSISDWARHRKRRREDVVKKEIGQFIRVYIYIFLFFRVYYVCVKFVTVKLIQNWK